MDIREVAEQRKEAVLPFRLRRDGLQHEIEQRQHGVNSIGIYRKGQIMPTGVLVGQIGADRQMTIPETSVMRTNVSDVVQCGQPRFENRRADAIVPRDRLLVLLLEKAETRRSGGNS